MNNAPWGEVDGGPVVIAMCLAAISGGIVGLVVGILLF